MKIFLMALLALMIVGTPMAASAGQAPPGSPVTAQTEPPFEQALEEVMLAAEKLGIATDVLSDKQLAALQPLQAALIAASDAVEATPQFKAAQAALNELETASGALQATPQFKAAEEAEAKVITASAELAATPQNRARFLAEEALDQAAFEACNGNVFCRLDAQQRLTDEQ